MTYTNEDLQTDIDYLMDDVPLQDIICWPEIEKLTLISGRRNPTARLRW